MEKQNKLKDSLLSFLQNLFDLMILNWLWLLCCLPIITIGPATCGMYRVTLKIVREEPVSPVKDFFRGFRSNFKSGLAMGLIATVLLVLAAGDIWFALQISGGLHSLYLVLGIVIGAVWLIIISYAFALQAMFDSPLKVQLVNTFKLAVVAPGQTLLIWLILLSPVIVLLVLPPIALKMLGFIYLIVGISAPVYGASHILRRLFDRVNGGPVAAQPLIEE